MNALLFMHTFVYLDQMYTTVTSDFVFSTVAVLLDNRCYQNDYNKERTAWTTNEVSQKYISERGGKTVQRFSAKLVNSFITHLEQPNCCLFKIRGYS